MARIPEHIVEQIRQSTDIVTIISEVVMLKQRGRNYIGLCPFHGEKTPSFNVNQERGIYKCFGCGKGGDAVKFLMEYHKLGYGEALRSLADRAGIRLEETASDGSDSANKYDLVYSALKSTAHLFQELLMKHEGLDALRYIRTREFSADTIQKFALGYAPNAWDVITKELTAQGYTEETLLSAGLVVKKEGTGRVYDRFRNRVMFPIHNEVGRVIGFGARQLEEDGMGKYINSAQGLVYDKSKVLYGLFQAKEEIRRKGFALLTEGYADVITVWQAGFKNVIASSGTALTKEQLRLLARYCTHIKLVYDADTAGINAALRGMDTALEEGFDIDIVRLPKGEDPDSMIRTKGIEAFERAVQSTASLVAFKADVMDSQGLLSTPRGQTQAVRSILDTIAKVPDRLKRDFMVKQLAQLFALRETDVHQELESILRHHTQQQRRNQSREQHRTDRTTLHTTTTAHHHTDTTATSHIVDGRQTILRTAHHSSTDQHIHDGATPLPFFDTPHSANDDDRLRVSQLQELFVEEETLLRSMLTIKECIPHITDVLCIQKHHFSSETAQILFQAILSAAQHSADPLHILIADESLPEDYGMLIAGFAIQTETPSIQWKEQFDVEIPDETKIVIDDCARELILRRLRTEANTLQHTIQQSPDLAKDLFFRCISIDKTRRIIEQTRGHSLDVAIETLVDDTLLDIFTRPTEQKTVKTAMIQQGETSE